MKKYARLNKTEKKAINSIMSCVRAIGYSPSVIRFVQDEMCKDIHTNYNASVCKCCGRIRYKVTLGHAYNVPPIKPRMCVECAPPDDTTLFVPKCPLLVVST